MADDDTSLFVVFLLCIGILIGMVVIITFWDNTISSEEYITGKITDKSFYNGDWFITIDDSYAVTVTQDQYLKLNIGDKVVLYHYEDWIENHTRYYGRV